MAQKKQKQEESYWLDRGIKQEKKINDAAQRVEQKVISAYRKAQSYLTKQARNLFNRAKQRSGMDEDETRALLNQAVQPDELVELRKLADDISNPELQESARKRLNGLAFKERITRAEDLKAKSFLVSKQIADVQLEKQTDFYIDVIHDSYREAVAEDHIRRLEQQGVTFEIWNKSSFENSGHEFKELSTKYTKNILDSHWHGSNYSKRIWNDTEALAKRLEELFTVETMTGMSEFEMAKAIAAEFDRSIGVAQRLIRTEDNYMANQAKLKAWRDRGVKEYRLIAVLDFRTSKICQGKDGKIYLVSEAVVNGAAGTYPPFHPWCRTIAVAYIGKRSLTGKRTANDPFTVKTMTIEQRDTYDDWMKKLKGNYSDREIEIQKKKIQNRKRDSADLKRMKDILGEEYSPKSLEEYQETKYNDSNEWDNLKKLYRDVKWMKDYQKNSLSIYSTKSKGKRIPMPSTGEPKSVVDRFVDGDHVTRRYFGRTGKPRRDIDFTDHGTSTVHTNPHTHVWQENDTDFPEHIGHRELSLSEKIANKKRSDVE